MTDSFKRMRDFKRKYYSRPQGQVNPVVIGRGKTMFEGVKDRFPLKLTKSRVFKIGNVLLTYKLF